MIRTLVDMVKRHKVAVGLVVLLIMGLLLPRAKNWEAEIESVREEISGIEERITVLEDGFANVAESVAGMEAGIASIESNYAKFGDSINTLTGKVNTFADNYTHRLDSLNDMWVMLHDDTAVSQSTLEMVLKRLAELEQEFFEVDGTVRLLISHNVSDGFSTDECGWGAIAGKTLRGQQITIGSRSIDLRRVRFYSKRFGSPETVNLRIYATGSDDLPLGDWLYERSINVAAWSTTPDWNSFIVSDCILLANLSYCIIVEDSDGNAKNRIEMAIMYGGQYAGGEWVQSSDGGFKWAPVKNAVCDGGFEIWGITR